MTKASDALYRSIAKIFETAHSTAYRTLNAAMVQVYKQIGSVIFHLLLPAKSLRRRNRPASI